MPASTLQDKTVQRRTFQLLFRAAAAIVVLTFVIDRIGIRRHVNLDIFQPVFFQQVHVYDDTQHVTHFVRYVLQQFAGIGNADNLTVVVHAYIYLAACGVGKAAYPFQILVTPAFFPFRILVFIHNHSFVCKISKNTVNQERISVILPP